MEKLNHLFQKMNEIDKKCNNYIEKYNWDSVLLIRIKQLYSYLSGDITNIWHEAHETFAWISTNQEKYQLIKTKAFINKNINKNTLQSQRLKLLASNHKMINE